jgi:hypothetical protein
MKKPQKDYLKIRSLLLIAGDLHAKLGFRVKELIGGIEYWRKEGGKVEGTLGDKSDMYWQMKSTKKIK